MSRDSNDAILCSNVLVSSNDYYIFRVDKYDKVLSINGNQLQMKGIVGIDAPDWVTMVVYRRDLGLFMMGYEFRHGINTFIHEFISGTVDKDEIFIHAAKRELCEEFGYQSFQLDNMEWHQLFVSNPNAAFMMNNHATYLVIVDEDPSGVPNLDSNELVTHKYVTDPFSILNENSSSIQYAVTYAAINKLAELGLYYHKVVN